jgi:hypothetical protein
MARQFVLTKVRLYDYNEATKTRLLAYPVGAQVPLAEYERLVRMNSAAAAKRVETKDVLPEEVASKAAAAAPDIITVPEPDDPKPKAAPPAFHTMLRAQLLVEAKARGLEVSTRMTKAQLIELLEKATS